MDFLRTALKNFWLDCEYVYLQGKIAYYEALLRD